jgi:myo-inositol-1(or 4)-monophosphatase
MADRGPYAELSEFASRIASRAAADIREAFLGEFEVDSKGRTNLVTEVDRRVEEYLFEAVRGEYPDHSILAEEGHEATADTDWLWVIDPLDGTNNFAHGYPMVAVSVAVQYKGKTVVGVVHDAIHDEGFYATAKGGAWAAAGGAWTATGGTWTADDGARTERGRLRVSGSKSLIESIVATGFPYDKHESDVDNLGNWCRVTKRVRGIRRGGSAALDLAYVAAGRLDAFWELKLSPWDTAAGVLLVTEAGGVVSRFDGSPFSIYDIDIVAGTPAVYEELKPLLRIEG